jgi:hypothetical protein
MGWIRLLALKLGEWAPWIAAVGVLLGGHWAADALREGFEIWIRGEEVTFSFVNFVYIVFFFVVVVWFYRVRHTILQPRTRFLHDREIPEKREHLVLFLSELDLTKGRYSDGVPEGATLSGDLDIDIAALEAHKKSNPHWRWEMPLRAIRHHMGRLKTIVLVCSPESIKQVHWFRQLLGRYSTLANVSVWVLSKENGKPTLIDCPTTPLSSGGLSFDSFDELSSGMRYILRRYGQRRVSEDEIMIDFTGGPKVTSVVAAAITFNRNIKAQYVQTNPPWNVVSYDILLGSVEAGGLESI